MAGGDADDLQGRPFQGGVVGGAGIGEPAQLAGTGIEQAQLRGNVGFGMDDQDLAGVGSGHEALDPALGGHGFHLAAVHRQPVQLINGGVALVADEPEMAAGTVRLRRGDLPAATG